MGRDDNQLHHPEDGICTTCGTLVSLDGLCAGCDLPPHECVCVSIMDMPNDAPDEPEEELASVSSTN